MIKTALKNIREQYSPATAEDIIELAKKWYTDIVPKLGSPKGIYANEVSVEPAPNYDSDGTARLIIVFDDKDKDNNRYLYFMNKKNLSDFADDLSQIIGKKVELDITTRKGIKDTLDNKSLAFDKIDFDNIKFVDAE